MPAGEIAGAWLIRENLTDLFIGYAHYAAQMAAYDDLHTLLIPPSWNVRCDYLLAQIEQSAAAVPLYPRRGGAALTEKRRFFAYQRRIVNCGASSGSADPGGWTLRTAKPYAR